MFQSATGLSASQGWLLPNGQTLNLALSNTFNAGPNGRPVTAKGSSIAFA